MADKELTFWDHLDELRRVLFLVRGVRFGGAAGYFCRTLYLFAGALRGPCHNDLVVYDLLR